MKNTQLSTICDRELQRVLLATKGWSLLPVKDELSGRIVFVDVKE